MCEEGDLPEDAAMGLYSDFCLITDQDVSYVDIPFDRDVSLRSW